MARLIDKDAVLAKLHSAKEYIQRTYVCEFAEIEVNGLLIAAIDAIVPAIESIPADNVYQKRGRWIESRTDLICSACKWTYSDELLFMSHNGLDAIYEAFAYCPHCGARMDGSAENGKTD